MNEGDVITGQSGRKYQIGEMLSYQCTLDCPDVEPFYNEWVNGVLCPGPHAHCALCGGPAPKHTAPRCCFDGQGNRREDL